MKIYLKTNMQNGKNILEEYFSNVQEVNYIDSLHITNTNDLIGWVTSAAAMANINEDEINKMYYYFENIREKNSAIDIPKEAGIFISQKQEG